MGNSVLDHAAVAWLIIGKSLVPHAELVSTKVDTPANALAIASRGSRPFSIWPKNKAANKSPVPLGAVLASG